MRFRVTDPHPYSTPAPNRNPNPNLVQVWTNDRWRSPPHRVVNPPPDLAALGRLSLVFFTGPADDTVVEALPSTHGADRPKRCAPRYVWVDLSLP